MNHSPPTQTFITPPPPTSTVSSTSTTTTSTPTTQQEQPEQEWKDSVTSLNGIWQADNSSPTCKLCHINFGGLIRRHHCRRCGHIVCGKCSAHRGYGTILIGQPEKISQEKGKKVRLCTVCHDEQVKHTHQAIPTGT